MTIEKVEAFTKHELGNVPPYRFYEEYLSLTKCIGCQEKFFSDSEKPECYSCWLKHQSYPYQPFWFPPTPRQLKNLQTSEQHDIRIAGDVYIGNLSTIDQSGMYFVAATGSFYSYFDGQYWWTNGSQNAYDAKTENYVVFDEPKYEFIS